MLHNRIKTLQLLVLYYATLFYNLEHYVNSLFKLYLCYIYYFFNTLIKYKELQTLDSLIFTWFTNSKHTDIFYRLWIHSFQGLKRLTLFIIETYTLAYQLFLVSYIFYRLGRFTNRYLIHLFQGLKCLPLPIIETYTCISICHFH